MKHIQYFLRSDNGQQTFVSKVLNATYVVKEIDGRWLVAERFTIGQDGAEDTVTHFYVNYNEFERMKTEWVTKYRVKLDDTDWIYFLYHVVKDNTAFNVTAIPANGTESVCLDIPPVIRDVMKTQPMFHY